MGGASACSASASVPRDSAWPGACFLPPRNGWPRGGRQAFAFQREVWQAVAQGRSGLLHATTGSGKTYAVGLGMLAELLLRHAADPPAKRPPRPCARSG